MKPMFLNIFRSNVAVLATTLLVGTALSSLAYDITVKTASNVDASGVILGGIDPTSYATGVAAVAGAEDFAAEVGGATYLFASAKARDSFVAALATFEPAFGGFCATGAALGNKPDGDPANFRNFEEQLYLFVSEDPVAIWDKDPAGTLAKANANWPNIRDKTPASLE
jgi:hypothetical protein